VLYVIEEYLAIIGLACLMALVCFAAGVAFILARAGLQLCYQHLSQSWRALSAQAQSAFGFKAYPAKAAEQSPTQ
jgi:hypothetical protein